MSEKHFCLFSEIKGHHPGGCNLAPWVFIDEYHKISKVKYKLKSLSNGIATYRLDRRSIRYIRRMSVMEGCFERVVK